MSLLERPYFKCPSCECECHLGTETLSEKEKDNTPASLQPSEINTELSKECKDTTTKFGTDLTNFDNEKETLNIKEKDSDSSSGMSGKSNKVCSTVKDSHTKLKVDLTDVEDGEKKFQGKGESLCKDCMKKRAQHHHTVSGRGNPCMKFVWNKHMLKDLDTILHSDWLLYITHGFIGQCSILLFMRRIINAAIFYALKTDRVL